MLTLRQSFISSVIDACPRLAQLTYLDRIERATTFDLAVGTLFHLTYECYFKSILSTGTHLSFEDLSDYVTSLINNRVISTENGDIDLDDISSYDGELHTDKDLKDMALSVVQAYYNIATGIDDVRDSEVYGKIEVAEVTITTHLDLLCQSGIKEFKTARVKQRGRIGRITQYFPDYDRYAILTKTQPHIHLLVFGVQQYQYHVVGKGVRELTASLDVDHGQEHIDIWTNRVLIPTLTQIKAGIFHAKRSGLCTVCPFAKDSRLCGMLL